MTQNPLSFRSFTWDDSNAFRWSATRATLTSNIVIKPEKDAPYTTRELFMPPNADEKEIKAMVEGVVAIPQRGKAQAFRVPAKKTDTLKPMTPKTTGDNPFGLLLIIIVGLYVLDGKK